MKKKNIIILIILLPLFIFTIYKLIILFKFNNLEKYNFIDNEIVIKEIKYNNKNYIISRYYNNSSSWSNLNILLNSNNAYYILKNIEKCDTLDNGSNIYIKDNEFYIHCIGKENIINKYTINNLKVNDETIKFNFKNAPNISTLHMIIDNVDSEYIYLSSSFKVDNTIKDESKVKCSFKDKECNYIK